MSTISQLRPKLYLTDADGVSKLPGNHPYDEVVTLGYVDLHGNKYPDASTTERRFKFRDGGHKHEQFEAATAYVVEHLRAGDTVLVHCQAGVSRSTAVCIAALATLEDRQPKTVRTAIEEAHPRTNPQPDIWKSAVQFVEDRRQSQG
jgi:protein-tyrosine phosphatase